MLEIDFKEDLGRFEIRLPRGIDRDFFYSIISKLKSSYCKYDPQVKTWHFPHQEGVERLHLIGSQGLKYSLNAQASAAMKSIASMYKSEYEIFEDRKLNLSVFNEGIALKPFQKEDVDTLIKRKYALISHCPGAGKTIIATSIFSSLYKDKHLDGIVIIAPSSICYNWKQEILRFVNTFKEKDIVIVSNETKVKPFDAFKSAKVLIIPEHLVFHTIASYRDDYKERKSFKKVQWRELDIKKYWSKESIALFWDEGHAFRDVGAIRTKSMLALREQFNYKFFITATPAINHFEQWYPMLTFMDRSLAPMSETGFRVWLAKKIGTSFSKYHIVSYNEARIEELKETINKKVMVRRDKSQIPGWDVELHLKQISLQITEKHKALYNLVKQNQLEVLDREFEDFTFRTVFNKFAVLLMALDNPLLLSKKMFNVDGINDILKSWDPLRDDAKLQFLNETLERYIEEQNKKVIVYITHPSTGDMLEQLYTKYKPLKIHGLIKEKDKAAFSKQVEDTFNTTEDNKLLILSALTTSAGVNLNAKCSNILVYDLPADATHTVQLSSRTDRVTSKVDSLVEIPFYPMTFDQIRIERSMNRMNLNALMNKPCSRAQLKRLLEGVL